MPTVVHTYSESAQARKASIEMEGIYLALACIGMCMFAIALALKYPSIAEAVVILS